MHLQLVGQGQHQHRHRPEGGQVARLLGILLDQFDQLATQAVVQLTWPSAAWFIVQPSGARGIEAPPPFAHRLVPDREDAGDLGHCAVAVPRVESSVAAGRPGRSPGGSCVELLKLFIGWCAYVDHGTLRRCRIPKRRKKCPELGAIYLLIFSGRDFILGGVHGIVAYTYNHKHYRNDRTGANIAVYAFPGKCISKGRANRPSPQPWG